MFSKIFSLTSAIVATSALLSTTEATTLKPRAIDHLFLVDCTNNYSNISYSAMMEDDQVALVGIPAVTWERQNTSGIFSTGFAVTVDLDAAPWRAYMFNSTDLHVMNYTCERGDNGHIPYYPDNADCLIRHECVKSNGTSNSTSNSTSNTTSVQ